MTQFKFMQIYAANLHKSKMAAKFNKVAYFATFFRFQRVYATNLKY